MFNLLTGYSNQTEYRGLVVAPARLRKRLEELIDREAEHAKAGRPARLIIKVNALTDDQMIRVLYRASQAGLDIELLVRGVCSLRPGIPGISDRIHVRSVVGRFLEHSRIYWFQNGGDEEMYIGSADLMERNLDRRVETLCPIRDPEILSHLRDIVLGAYLRDTAARDAPQRRRQLQPAGRRRAVRRAGVPDQALRRAVARLAARTARSRSRESRVTPAREATGYHCCRCLAMRPSTSAATRSDCSWPPSTPRGGSRPSSPTARWSGSAPASSATARLSDSSMDLACRVLERMTSEYRDFKVDAVRAVGTSALRDASNQVEFVARASAIMRTPLYVISGAEEARLVQRGRAGPVAASAEAGADRGHRRRQRPADPERERPAGRVLFEAARRRPADRGVSEERSAGPARDCAAAEARARPPGRPAGAVRPRERAPDDRHLVHRGGAWCAR